MQAAPTIARRLRLLAPGLAALALTSFSAGGFAAPPPPAPPPIRQVYLVQDSGWMEPFYSDPSAPFRPLVQALVEHFSGRQEPLRLM